MDVSPIRVAGDPSCARNRSVRRRGGGRHDRRSREDGRQRRKRADVDAWAFRDPHRSPRNPIEHPGRKLQPPARIASLKAAAQHLAGFLRDRLVDTHNAPRPGMPAIQNLALFRLAGPVGVPSPRSTTTSVRTRAATASAKHPRRPSLTPHPAPAKNRSANRLKPKCWPERYTASSCRPSGQIETSTKNPTSSRIWFVPGSRPSPILTSRPSASMYAASIAAPSQPRRRCARSRSTR